MRFAFWVCTFVSCARLSSCLLLIRGKCSYCICFHLHELITSCFDQVLNSICNFVFFQFYLLVFQPGSGNLCSGLHFIDFLGFCFRCLPAAFMELELGFSQFCYLLSNARLQRCLRVPAEILLIFSACRSSLGSFCFWLSIMRKKVAFCCWCPSLEIWFPCLYLPLDLMIWKPFSPFSLAFCTHHQTHWFSCRRCSKHWNLKEYWCRQVGPLHSLMLDDLNYRSHILWPDCS